MTRGGRVALLAAALVVVGAAACTEVGTNPQSVVSIVADTTPVVSVIVGDTLRDSLGNPFPLRKLGRAFNPQGSELPDAPFTTFLAPVTASDISRGAVDSSRVVTAANGERYLVVGRAPTNDTTAVDVSVQYSQGLRITRRFQIVPRPDTAVADVSTSVTRLAFPAGTSTQTATLAVLVRYDSAGTPRPARYTLVRFDANVGYTSARVSRVRFVEAGRRAADSASGARFDTVDVASGIASRQVIVTRSAAPVDTAARDTITAAATVLVGSPLHAVRVPFTIVVHDTIG